jgi:hypothetical protein
MLGFSPISDQPVSGVAFNPLFETLQDPFNLSTLTVEKWTQFTAGGATLTFDSAGAQVNYPASTTSSTDGDISSNVKYTLANSYVYQRVPVVPNAGGITDAELRVFIDGNNWIRWVYEGGTLFAQYLVASVKTTAFSVAYDATTHLWWQIREGSGNGLGGTPGTVYWDTSTDGQTWTNRASVANPITVTDLRALIAGLGTGVDSSPGAFRWSSFNTIFSTPDKWGSVAPDMVSRSRSRSHLAPYEFRDLTVPSSGETITPDKWLGSYPDRINRAPSRVFSYPSVMRDDSPQSILALPDTWLGSRPDKVFSPKDRRSLYPSFFRDDNPIAAAETITPDKLLGSMPDILFRSKDRRYLYPQPVMWMPDALDSLAWRPVLPDIQFRQKDRRALYPASFTWLPDVVAGMAWRPIAPDVVSRSKDRRSLYPSFFRDDSPIATAEIITLDKWLGSQPNIVFRLKDRRHLYPDIFRRPFEVPEAITLDKWLPQCPDVIYRLKSRRYMMPYRFGIETNDFGLPAIDYCDPLTLWNSVALQTTGWTAQSGLQNTAWAGVDSTSTFWNPYGAVLDAWDSNTDTWDLLTDTWDANLVDGSYDNPINTNWVPETPQTTRWDPRCDNN